MNYEHKLIHLNLCEKNLNNTVSRTQTSLNHKPWNQAAYNWKTDRSMALKSLNSSSLEKSFAFSMKKP